MYSFLAYILIVVLTLKIIYNIKREGIKCDEPVDDSTIKLFQVMAFLPVLNLALLILLIFSEYV